MSDIEVTRVSSRGQVVIPKGIREAMEIEEGDRLLVYAMGDRLVMRRIREEESLLSVIARPIRAKIERAGITRADVGRAIEESRKAA
ncbi:MAG: AbrB/MazE/SpoVT family DNA-binding domain-containing protein [Candidatus Bathyarchaeia archaeon]